MVTRFEKPREFRGSPKRVILSQAQRWEGATTIPKGSTLQANGSGSARGPVKVYDIVSSAGQPVAAPRAGRTLRVRLKVKMREAIYAASTDEGAFVRTTKEAVKRAVESYMRNCERIMFGDGTGALGAGDGSTNVSGTGTAGDPYVVVISDASWVEANWEERDYVNYDAETTNLEIQAVDPAAKSIDLVGSSAGLFTLTGAGPVPTNKFFHMQKSKDNDPIGLRGVLEATSGSIYGIPVSRRWRAAVNDDKSGAGLTTDMMNETCLEIRRKCGKDPNLIICSYTQMRKLLNLLEDQKEYVIEPRSKDLKGKISFKAIEFYSQAGPMPVVPARFCKEDEMFFLNDQYLTVHHRPGFGWFSDDGTVFLRDVSTDSYSARYGGYYENYFAPPFHGLLKGLAT